MKPYSPIEHKARENGHASSFDRHHFHQDGGDKLFSGSVIQNPGKVDEGLWKKAEKASEEAFGERRWPFISWWYQKQGGTFG